MVLNNFVAFTESARLLQMSAGLYCIYNEFLVSNICFKKINQSTFNEEKADLFQWLALPSRTLLKRCKTDRYWRTLAQQTNIRNRYKACIKRLSMYICLATALRDFDRLLNRLSKTNEIISSIRLFVKSFHGIVRSCPTNSFHYVLGS